MENKITENRPKKIYELTLKNNYSALIRLRNRLGRILADFDKKPLLDLFKTR